MLTNHLINLQILQNTPDGARATSVTYIIQHVVIWKLLSYHIWVIYCGITSALCHYSLIYDLSMEPSDPDCYTSYMLSITGTAANPSLPGNLIPSFELIQTPLFLGDFNSRLLLWNWSASTWQWYLLLALGTLWELQFSSLTGFCSYLRRWTATSQVWFIWRLCHIWENSYQLQHWSRVKTYPFQWSTFLCAWLLPCVICQDKWRHGTTRTY